MDLTTGVPLSTHIIYLNPIFVLNLDDWFSLLPKKIIIFWYSIRYIIILILAH